MIVDILTHTPAWVFVVFAVLIAVGIRLARPTRVAVSRLLIVPVAMAALSMCGLVQAFGAASVAVVVWAALSVSALAVGCVLPARSDVQYSTADRRLTVPGSWLPLTLMMTIFCTRYATAVLLAMHADLARSLPFAAIVGAIGGITTGAFVLRAVRIARVARRNAGATGTVVPA